MEDDVKPIAEALTDAILETSRRRHQARLRRLKENHVDLAAPVGSTSLLSKKPMQLLRACLPDRLTVRELIEHTTEQGLRDAASRLEQCARCPKRGGACAGADREGRRPEWTAVRPTVGTSGMQWSDCQRWRMYVIDQTMLRSGFPDRLVPKGFDDFAPEDPRDAQTLQHCRMFVEHFYHVLANEGGIALHGGVGAGKTHLAVATARELLARKLVRSVRFWDCTELLACLRNEADDVRVKALHHARSAGLLVLDDVGSHKTTDWVREQLGMVINHRWRKQLPMIVTSNDALEASAASLGERTVSRLMDATVYLPLVGRDRRLPAR